RAPGLGLLHHPRAPVDVVAGAEHPPGAAQAHHAHRRILVAPREGLLHVARELGRDGVQPVGAIEREGRDRTVLDEVDRAWHGGHHMLLGVSDVTSIKPWLRCYRCWSTDLEVQVHYEGIHKIDPETGER